MVVVMVVVVVFQMKISFAWFVACWKIYCTRTLNVVNNQQKEENQRLVRALVKHLFRVFVCCWLHFVLCIVLSGCCGWIIFWKMCRYFCHFISHDSKNPFCPIKLLVNCSKQLKRLMDATFENFMLDNTAATKNQ